MVYRTKNYITLKIKGQMLKKRCIKKYYSCDKTCQFSALQEVSYLSYFEKPTIAYNYI